MITTSVTSLEIEIKKKHYSPAGTYRDHHIDTSFRREFDFFNKPPIPKFKRNSDSENYWFQVL
jgi:hypothetical protein